MGSKNDSKECQREECSAENKPVGHGPLFGFPSSLDEFLNRKGKVFLAVGC